jgi:hypothetical protein
MVAIAGVGAPRAQDGGIDTCTAEGEVFEPATGACYRLSPDAASWPVAQQRCEARSEILVTVGSAAEDAFLDSSFAVSFWIGANDRIVEGRFEWLSDEPFEFSNFIAGDPDNLFGVQDCVEKAAPSGQWQDRACNVQNLFVCERNLQTGASGP